MKQVLRAGLAILLLVSGVAVVHAAEGPPSVTITAVEYAFDAPDQLDAGPVAITFRNGGKEPHNLKVWQFKPGIRRVVGDEGGFTYPCSCGVSPQQPAVIRFNKATADEVSLPVWYGGRSAAQITLTFDDGTVAGPTAPGQIVSQGGITIYQYLPGQQPYPWQSSNGDFAATGRHGVADRCDWSAVDGRTDRRQSTRQLQMIDRWCRGDVVQRDPATEGVASAIVDTVQVGSAARRVQDEAIAGWIRQSGVMDGFNVAIGVR